MVDMYQLRDLKLKDAEGMLEWMHDSEIASNFRFDSSNMNIDKVRAFIENSQTEETSKHFAVVTEEDEYIGTISLKNIDHTNKNAEYAVVFRKKALGSGAAKEATQLLLDKAFNEFKLIKVYLNVLSENIRAIRFYEKMGFIKEGEFKQHLYTHGRLQDLSWYAIFNGGSNDERL
jgi:diamine N-acetyltransferase